MVVGLTHARRTLARLRDRLGAADIVERLRPKAPKGRRVRVMREASAASIERLWALLEAETAAGPNARAALADIGTLERAEAYRANIESMIGTVKLPVGLVGPLQVNGLHAEGGYYVPLATTEAALVASYQRGSDVVAASGGVEAAVLARSVMRAPGFQFASILEAGRFLEWVAANEERLRCAAEATTRHGRLIGVEPHMLGEVVFLVCQYETGDAAGQNMATIATDALLAEIIAGTPVRPRHHFLEANFSGDKKASHLALIAGRGRKVTARVAIPFVEIGKRLHTTPETMLAYARLANLGALASGTLGAHGHIANGLAALYIATGQDAACVAESAMGFLAMEAQGETLVLSLTMPNIIVGTVGGGTSLPSQKAALDILGLSGTGHADALAEVTAALCLAGEISIIGALAAGHFARAHARLARDRR